MKPSSLVVGLDVPWVTCWTAETMLPVGPCPSLDGQIAILQTSNAGFGKPEYSKNHVVRQRMTVRKMLCPMCGEPTTEGDRVTQVARRIPAGWLRASGRGATLPSTLPDAAILLDAGSIAPLHRACSERSLIHCPHLRASPDVEVMDFTTRWVTMPLLIQAVMPPPASALLMLDPPRPKPVTAVTFLQICGVTDDSDPEWRANGDRYRGAA